MRAIFLIFLLVLLTPPLHAQANGCGASGFETGASERVIQAGGSEREYLLYVPESYTGEDSVPLVLTLHGFLNSRGQIAEWSKWNELADAENFIVVYPQGGGTPTRWNAGNAGFIGDYDVDDVGFIGEVVEEISGEWCIDAARVYVNGLSNGGGMTNRLACTMADVFAAAGTVSGAYTSWDEECSPERPIPVITFHGTSDRVVPFEGGFGGQFPNIEAWALNWALRNGCDSAAAVQVPVNTTVSATAYPGCDADVILYVIEDGGHSWPGDNFLIELMRDDASRQIDATLTMWSFFKEHPLQ